MNKSNIQINNNPSKKGLKAIQQKPYCVAIKIKGNNVEQNLRRTTSASGVNYAIALTGTKQECENFIGKKSNKLC